MGIYDIVLGLDEFLSDSTKLGLQFAFQTLLTFVGGERRPVTIPGAGRFVLRKHSSDLLVIRQVFRAREYEIPSDAHRERIEARYRQMLAEGRTPLIIDCGANNGASAVWFSTRFPEAKVIAVEPDARNIEICRVNCQAHPQIMPVHAAIGGQPGFVSIVDESAEAWAVQTRRTDGEAAIPVVTLNELAARHGGEGDLFLVKIDIEGFESDLFSANLEWLDGVTVMVIELHDWMLPGQFSSRPLQKAVFGRDFEMLIAGENLFFVR